MVLWKRLDMPGHEVCRLRADAREVTGTAIFSYARQACVLNYAIRCDAQWRTLDAAVDGWIGQRRVDARLAVLPGGHWRMNEADQPRVLGAIDVDLNFSPATNLLPLRRLNLPVGGTAAVRAAWLRFPQMTLEPLEQRYTRTGERTWRYESGNGAFTADLEVDEEGLVVRYGEIWEREN